MPLDPKMAVGSEHNPTLPHSHLVGDCCHLGSPREVPRQSKRNCDGGEVELNSAETKDGSIAKCWGELVRRHWRTSVGRRVNAVGALCLLIGPYGWTSASAQRLGVGSFIFLDDDISERWLAGRQKDIPGL